jgi:RHS repeat-associated protein
MFGLLNANARLYSPYLGRFISPDPLLNSDGGALDYNPYIYARNNPYKYIDRNGEFPWLLLGVAAIMGGFTNVQANFSNISNAGDFFSFFGIGAAAGALATCVGAGVNVALTGGSFGAGFLGVPAKKALTGFYIGAAIGAAGGCAGGLVTGAGNSWLNGSSFASGLLDGLKGCAMGGVSGAITGGLLGGIDALYKHTNFFTGIGNFDVSGAYSTNNAGFVKKLMGMVRAKYVHEFEGVNVYETKEFGICLQGRKGPIGSYCACTIPEHGIITGLGVYDNDIPMMQHEFGHILQYRKYGAAAYWSVIGLESLSSCQYATNQGNMSLHYNFWTETYANYLSKGYFGAKWLGGPDTNYPAVNISKFNLQRLRVGGRFFY